MSDPAVEAAQRVWKSHLTLSYPHRPAELGLWPVDAIEAGAREAFASILELHTPIRTAPDYAYCDECDTQWPCATAKLCHGLEPR